jgi:hypothetical protein
MWVRFFPEADAKKHVSLALAYETVNDRARGVPFNRESACFPTTNCFRKFPLERK